MLVVKLDGALTDIDTHKEVTVIEVVNGVVVGPVMHRVALCFNGREVAVGTVESWEEALIWCQSEWDRRKNDLLYGHYAGNNKSFPDFVQKG